MLMRILRNATTKAAFRPALQKCAAKALFLQMPETFSPQALTSPNFLGDFLELLCLALQHRRKVVPFENSHHGSTRCALDKIHLVVAILNPGRHDFKFHFPASAL